MRVQSDGDGYFRAEGLPYFNLRVDVVARGWGAWSQKVQLHPMIGSAHLVIEVTMTPGLVLKGKVVSAAQEPVAGAYIVIENDAGAFEKGEG